MNEHCAGTLGPLMSSRVTSISHKSPWDFCLGALAAVVTVKSQFDRPIANAARSAGTDLPARQHSWCSMPWRAHRRCICGNGRSRLSNVFRSGREPIAWVDRASSPARKPPSLRFQAGGGAALPTTSQLQLAQTGVNTISGDTRLGQGGIVTHQLSRRFSDLGNTRDLVGIYFADRDAVPRPNHDGAWRSLLTR